MLPTPTNQRVSNANNTEALSESVTNTFFKIYFHFIQRPGSCGVHFETW